MNNEQAPKLPVLPMPLQAVAAELSKMTTEDGVELIDLTLVSEEILTCDTSGNVLFASRTIIHHYMTPDGTRKLRDTLGELLNQTSGIILPGDLK